MDPRSRVARSTVDISRLGDNDIASIKAGVATGEVQAHYVHLAAGQRDNQASLSEWHEAQVVLRICDAPIGAPVAPTKAVLRRG